MPLFIDLKHFIAALYRAGICLRAPRCLRARAAGAWDVAYGITSSRFQFELFRICVVHDPILGSATGRRRAIHPHHIAPPVAQMATPPSASHHKTSTKIKVKTSNLSHVGTRSRRRRTRFTVLQQASQDSQHARAWHAAQCSDLKTVQYYVHNIVSDKQ